MILTVDEYEKYLPNTDGYFRVEKMEAFETRAIYKYFPKYIGNTLADQLVGSTAAAALLAKAKPAIACLALLESISFLDLVATNTGFAIVSNNNLAPASKERVNALRDGSLVSANVYFDQLLLFLETNADDYADWNQSCINEGSIIPGVTEFIAATKMHYTRHAFVELLPTIDAIENTALKSELSAEYLAVLQAGSDAVVKPLFICSLAFATLSKIEYDKPEPNPGVVKKYNRFAGDFLGRAITYMVENLDSYPEYRDNGYEKPYDNEIDGEESGIFIMG